jgi:multisubunit Na+/H+ antiporter MnhG subunit
VSEVLLWIGVAAQVVCVLGVVVMRGPFDRLHYAAAGTLVGPLLIGTALVLREGLNAASGEVVAGIGFLVLLSPAVTVATGRAARVVHYGDVHPRPEEIVLSEDT